MHNTNEFRNQLLSQLPQPQDLATYRNHVTEIIRKNQQRLRVEHVASTVFWIFCAASATAYLWFGNGESHLPRAPFLACIFFLWGGVELLKHRINVAQVELQKDLKQLQLQVLEMEVRGAKSSS